MFWSLMKQFGKKFSLERRARMIAATVPRRHWFRAAILMSRVHGHLSAAFTGRRRGIVEAYIREDCLIELSRRGPFHVPIRVIGAELLEPAESERAGVVLCGTHVPWNNVMIRAAILSGHKPQLIVTNPNSILLKDNQYLPTGLADGIPAAAPGPGSLLRIRTVLRNKGVVACTLDQRAGGKSHPDLLVLAGRLGARAVTFSAELARDGVVDITFRNTLHPYCESPQAIEENLQAILAEERRLLASLDGLEDSEVSIDALSQPETLTVAPEQAAETPFPLVATTPVKATRQL